MIDAFNSTSRYLDDLLNIGLGANLTYMGYFRSLLHPRKKNWVASISQDMSQGLGKPCFTKFLVV